MEQYYLFLFKHMFKFPSFRILITILLGLIAIVILSIIFYEKYYLIGSFLIAIYFFIIYSSNIIFYHNKKRFLGFLCIFFIFSILSFIDPYLIFISLIVSYVFIESGSRIFNYKLNFLIVLFPYILLFILFYVLNCFKIIETILSIILCFTVFLFLWINFSLFAKKYKLPIYEIVKGYIIWRFVGIKKYLESTLEKCSVEKEIENNVLLLHDKNMNKECLILFSRIHFGPIEDIGSSKLIEKLYDIIKNYENKELVIFHCEGSHENDLPSSHEVNRVIKALREISTISLPQYLKIKPIVVHEEGKIRCKALWLSGKILYFIERLGETTDDIPEWIYKNLKLNDNEILIDSQNSYIPNRPCIWKKEDIISLNKCIEICREKIEKQKEYYASCNIYSLEKSSLFMLNNDICSMGIKVLEFNYSENKKLGIIVIDANNILREERGYLEALLKNYFDDFIIVSTDNHSNTGKFLSFPIVPAFSLTNPVNIVALFDNLQLYKKGTFNYCNWIKSKIKVKVLGNSFYRFNNLVKVSKKLIISLKLIFLFIALLIIIF